MHILHEKRIKCFITSTIQKIISFQPLISKILNSITQPLRYLLYLTKFHLQLA
jgi:hypothetical protein